MSLTFFQASFSATANRDDIDINDPEFWQKWAKKADVDVDTLDTVCISTSYIFHLENIRGNDKKGFL